MVRPEDVPSPVEMLAGLVTGKASSSYEGLSVQRSHRFPVHLFCQIENMARMGNVPVSSIINQLIEVGIDAVRKELPGEVAAELSVLSNEQFARSASMLQNSSGGGKARRKAKAKGRGK